MAQNTPQAVAQAPPQASATRPARLYFVDHLRAALMILVVIHHVALVYGASVQGYYYMEPPFTDPRGFQDLLVFALLNQAWFMGAFFFLAGYFTPGSFDRKGSGAFLKDRLVRLGIPLIVFIFVLSPIANLGLYLMPSELTGITSSPSWEIYPRMIGLGPLWFVALLLIFSAGYVGWRWLTRTRPPAEARPTGLPGALPIIVFVLALAVVSFLMRMIVPLGQSVSVFVEQINFPTLAYLPQYLSFFVLGIVAFRQDWVRTLPGAVGVVGSVLAAVAVVVLFPLAISGQWFSLEVTPALDNALGNGHWQSAIYALWDSIFAVGLCLALIPLFRRVFNGRGWFGTFLGQQSYAVYVIHIPLVVFLAYALRSIELASVPKTVLASLLIVPACFIVAFLVRRLPFVARVL